MFSVRLVARPDARMVEVPLEIDAELPREFDGAAVLASSGLPRKVKIKAQKDALKLSTAYRADQLVADIVKSSLRGTAQDVQRVQEAVKGFIRTVRERRQEGATLVVSSNGRGKIDVAEQGPIVRGGGPAPAPVEAARASPGIDKRLGELEKMATERIAQLEQKVQQLEAQLAKSALVASIAGPGMERGAPAQAVMRSATAPRATSALAAFAQGLREELRPRVKAAVEPRKHDAERLNRAAALAAEAEKVFGVAQPGVAERLRESAAAATARLTAIERLAEELELYEPHEVPLAAQIVERLEKAERAPDPADDVEALARAVIASAKAADPLRDAWVDRAGLLGSWTTVSPAQGAPVDAREHEAIDGAESIGSVIVRGLRRADGSVLARARVSAQLPVAAAVTPRPSEPPPPEAVLATEPPPPAAPEVVAISDEPADDEEEVIPQAAMPAPPPRPAKASSGFGDLTAGGEIRPEEARAAAVAASQVPNIVQQDPAAADEALAAEVALAVETEVSADAGWAQVARGPQAFEEISDEDVEEVSELPPEKPTD